MNRASFVAWMNRARGQDLRPAERVMHWLALLACAFFIAVGFWEIFGPPGAGHYSTSAAYSISGENMVNWRKFAVFANYANKPVGPDQYYVHHPYGITMIQAVMYVIFGHHWFTVRAGALFCSSITPPLVYAFGRRAWGVIPASVATLFLVFVPIMLAFSTFGNLEEPTIAFGLLFGWASVRTWETGKARYIALSTIGAFGASNGDWAGLVFLGPVVIFAFFRAYVLPRSWYGRIDDRAYAKWFAYATAMAVGTVVVYLALFAKADKMNDLMGSYHQRSSGSEAALSEVLNTQRRKMWLGTMLTPIVFGAMGLGLPLAVLRLIKKPAEIFPIAWFISASFQYFVFKQGADIHIFWPHYYAPTAALAAGTFTATLLDGRAALLRLIARARRWKDKPEFPRFVRISTAIVIGLGIGIPILLLARMGIPSLVLARKTAGRFDQGGVYVGTDADEAEFARWAVENVATAGSTLQVYGRGEYGYQAEYGARRPWVRTATALPTKQEDPGRIMLVDTRYESAKDLESIARTLSIQAVGRYWRVDRAQPGPQLSVLRYDEHQPNAFEWLFITGTDLVRHISRDEDPLRTWELRDALSLPAPIPSAEPHGIEELRIAHNLAVRAGDQARADDLANQVAGSVGKPLNIKYTDGVTLQGIAVDNGSAIVVTMYWATDATYVPKDVHYQLKCKIIAPPPLWKGELDFYEKDMVGVPVIRPALWKPNGLYTQSFIALHRIGREECKGQFSGELHPVNGDQTPVVLTMD